MCEKRIIFVAPRAPLAYHVSMDDPTISWLLEGDVAVRYQTCRDLLGEDRPDLQRSIAEEGWGAALLARRNVDGSWGRGFYQPKWTSTHYTLLELRGLNVSPDIPALQQSVRSIARDEKGPDGGINPSGTINRSDVCINGMFLTYACYFGIDADALTSVVDFILEQRMADGGFNCRFNRSGATHSSLHSTLSVAEGILEYLQRGYSYRAEELADAAASSREFMLRHRLYRSDRTGEVIHPEFLKFTYPPRWKYNILRALDYFRAADPSPDTRRDPRMDDALHEIRVRRRPDGRWNQRAAHPGAVHVVLERAGRPGRWNTLMALRVLRHFSY